MVNLAKISIFALVGVMVAVLFVPSIRETLTRLFTPSETIFVPLDGTIGEAVEGEADGQQFKLITLLGFDGIPAILDPDFVSVDEAQAWMDPDEQVLGLSINGDNRAYSVRMLSRHEIVNDVVGGKPVAVTW